ncbi:MAG: Ig-like domain-containing protein [Bacilli bacterium]|nr:Ig-like domain-containing protein [Bacilli bacterium]
MKKIFLLVVLFLSLGLITSCTPSSSNVDGITISSSNNARTIKVNETLQLTAKVFPENADQSVVWSSENESIATVDQTGKVLAIAIGNVNIVATSKANTNIKQQFSLIVEEADEIVINPESITIQADNNQTTCKVGETISLTATVNPKEANQSVDWTSSDPEVATVSRGEVTALKEGSVVITANAKGYPNVKATITLTFEKADAPAVTKDWDNMDFASHEEYMTSEDGTPLKVKGVVTHVNPLNENTVTYLIQNGTKGYYIYAQNYSSFPVELGKVYEIGGFKKYYRGLNEIVNVEYCKEIKENITYTTNKITTEDVTSLEEMSTFHSSFVTAKAVFKNANVNDTKAYSFYAAINGKEIAFRVDPSYMTAEEFAAINQKVLAAVEGMEFEFVGIMTAFGYGAPSPQIQIVKAENLKFAELSDKALLDVAAESVTIASSIAFSVNEIILPTSVANFADVKISWTSNSDVINVANGTINHKSENVTVTLTATFTYKNETCTKNYSVIVFAADNATYEVLASLDLEDALAPNSWGNSESKSGYAEGTVTLGTPKYTWLLRNALIAAATNDIYNGTLGIRAQAGKTKDATGRIEIQNDDEYNVVEFATAVYGNDALGIQIMIEYSLDSGKTWTACQEVITVDSKTMQTYRINLPEGVKRVAIVIVENSGRRVNIDDIKLMK